MKEKLSELKRLRDMKTEIEIRIKDLSEEILPAMTDDRVILDDHTIARKGYMTKALITNPETVPDFYRESKVNKSAVAKELKAGREFKWAELQTIEFIRFFK